MVCVAHCSSLYSYLQAHPPITLAHDDIVNATPLLGLRMLPYLLVYGFLRKPHDTHSGPMDRDKREKLFTSIVDDSIPMWPSHSSPPIPYTLPGSHTSIEVIKNHILFSCWYCSQDALKVLEESVLHLSTCCPRGSITRHHMQLCFLPFTCLQAC